MRTPLFLLMISLAGFLSGNRPVTNEIDSEQARFCQIFGSIAVVNDPREAHFSVYLEESEGLADIIVFREEIRLYADREGIWYFMKNPGLADYIIYFEDNKHFADFSISYTDIESFARCNN